jgi:hypothetical protein
MKIRFLKSILPKINSAKTRKNAHRSRSESGSFIPQDSSQKSLMGLRRRVATEAYSTLRQSSQNKVVQNVRIIF